MPYIGASPSSELANLDINGQKLILDADADTSITADTDDQIDVEISGADDFRFTANTFTALSGSTIAIASGATIANSGTATGFASFAGIDDQSSSNDDQLTITDTAVIINEDSDDVDFRIESNGNANMFIVNGGSNLVGVASDPDLGVGLHVRSADAGGGSINASADELVIENSGDAGLTVLTPADGTARLCFSDLADNDAGAVAYSHSSDQMTLRAGGTNTLTVDSGKMYIGDDADGSITTGMTINQGAADNATFALKSSDVAHGVTGYVETDTYFFIVKEEAANGNAALYGFGEDNTGITLVGVAPNGVTDKTTTGHAYIEFDARKKSGTGADNAASNENIINASHNGSVKFIVDAEGDLHVDGSTTITAYDEYEDAQLGRALELSHGKGVINSKFDKFISYNHEKLADLQLVGREKDGSPNHFLNVTGLQRLHNGAIWQQYEKHENLLNAVYELAVEAVGEDKANKILDKNDIKLLSKNELLN